MAVSRFRAILSQAARNASRWASKTSGFKYLFRYGREIWGIKKGISKMLWQDIEAYVNGKTAFIEQVLLEIEKECENPEVALQSPAAPAFPLILRDDYPWQTRRGAVQLLTN